MIQDKERSTVMIRFVSNLREFIKKPLVKRPPLESDSASIEIEWDIAREIERDESSNKSKESDSKSIPPAIEIKTYSELLEYESNDTTTEDVLENPIPLGDVITMNSDDDLLFFISSDDISWQDILRTTKMTQTCIDVHSKGTQTEILEEESRTVDKESSCLDNGIETSSSYVFDVNNLI